MSPPSPPHPSRAARLGTPGRARAPFASTICVALTAGGSLSLLLPGSGLATRRSLSEMLLTKFQERLMNCRLISGDQTRQAQLPIDLRAFDPPANQPTGGNFFAD